MVESKPVSIWDQYPTKCTLCDTLMPLKVCKSAAGYYLGYFCPKDGPYSRETHYWATEAEAKDALERWLNG